MENMLLVIFFSYITVLKKNILQTIAGKFGKVKVAQLCLTL